MNQDPEYILRELIRKTDYKLVVAESCTGGLVGDLITNVPGSSEYFLGGVITYSNDAKEKILGVRQETLINFGAVSRETAIEMAENVRNLFSHVYPIEKLIGASISGIAGPGGGSKEKPVGLVWIGTCLKKPPTAFKYYWNGTRKENKYKSAYQCILQINELLK